jgi:hypothetical protein
MLTFTDAAKHLTTNKQRKTIGRYYQELRHLELLLSSKRAQLLELTNFEEYFLLLSDDDEVSVINEN